MLIVLQWLDEMQQVYQGNHTAQLIGDHIGKTADEIWNDVVNFVKKHREYASQIGSVIWECKKWILMVI